jgi:hypothetical protein
VVSPVTAYQNKWPSDWQQHWFYHTVTPLTPGESQPLATKELPPVSRVLHEEPLLPRRRRICDDASLIRA